MLIAELLEGSSDVRRLERFHVLALAKIDEQTNEGENNRVLDNNRRQSLKVDNWDLVYNETKVGGGGLCPNNRCNENVPVVSVMCGCKTKNITPYSGEHKDCLLPDIPLDARKVTTLRRHYYPEGGWGWIIIICTVLVHIFNHGTQLSCSQLVVPAAEKFKTLPVHIAGKIHT